MWSLVGLLLFCSAFIRPSQALPPLVKRHTDFQSVRTHLDWDYSNKDEDSPEKYFHESSFHQHYDGRFAEKPLEYKEKLQHLTTMITTFFETMNDVGAEAWIMHGTLLGWWWNRRILPWDSDLDVMVSEKSIHHLANFYNMTVHQFEVAGTEETRDFMLEINPHYSIGNVDETNKIDARWIDMDTGLFIDITTLRRNETAEAEGKDGAMMVKDKHHYMYDDIYPLRESVLEGTAVRIPYAYAELLIEEYGEQALSDVYFQSHHFDTQRRVWMPLRWADPRVHHGGQGLGLTYWGAKITEFWA